MRVKAGVAIETGSTQRLRNKEHAMSQFIRIDNRILVAHCDPMLDYTALNLLEYLLMLHKRGPALRAGSVIDFVWLPLRIERGSSEADAQTLQVCEPEFGSEPLRWQPGVDVTLSVVQQQLEWARRVGARPQPPRWNAFLRAEPGAEQAGYAFFVRQFPHGEGDSGVVLGVERPDMSSKQAAALRRRPENVQVGEWARNHPHLAGLLALPPGYMAFLCGGKIVQINDVFDQPVYIAPS